MIRPHQTSPVTDGSSTTNLSCAERPVCTPVVTTRAPSTDSRPSSRRTASATSAGAVRLACTGRDAWTPVPASASAASGLPVRVPRVRCVGGKRQRLCSSLDGCGGLRADVAMIRAKVRNNPAHPHNFELCAAPSKWLGLQRERSSSWPNSTGQVKSHATCCCICTLWRLRDAAGRVRSFVSLDTSPPHSAHPYEAVNGRPCGEPRVPPPRQPRRQRRSGR